jgi:vacuolar-type H+-ATPase subunit I/STV1
MQVEGTLLEMVKGDGPVRTGILSVRVPAEADARYREVAALLGIPHSVLVREVLEAHVPALQELTRRLKGNPDRYDRVSQRRAVQQRFVDMLAFQGGRMVTELALTPEEELEQLQRDEEELEATESWIADQAERDAVDQAERDAEEEQNRLTHHEEE